MDDTQITGPASDEGIAQAPTGEEAPSVPPGFSERGRIRRRMRFLRKARELAYRDLGGLVFDLHRFGRRNDSLVLAKLETIGRIDTELRALETTLAEHRPVTILREAGVAACPRCAAIHGSDDRFCPNCGLAMDLRAERPVAGPQSAVQPPAPAATPMPAPAMTPTAAFAPAPATSASGEPPPAGDAPAPGTPTPSPPAPPSIAPEAPAPSPPAPPSIAPEAPAPSPPAPPSGAPAATPARAAPVPRAAAPPAPAPAPIAAKPTPAAPAAPARSPSPPSGPALAPDEEPAADESRSNAEEPTKIVRPPSQSP
jgi:hypothetical protein